MTSTTNIHLTFCKRHDDVAASPLNPEFLPASQDDCARITP